MVSVRVLAKILAVALLGALTACGFARVPYESGQQSSKTASVCDRSTGVSGNVRVCAGDTLIGLSRQYDVTVLGIVRENGLTNDQIQAGQILTMPNEFVHVVQPGDQALTLANRYSVPFADLVAANGLHRPYVIIPEQRLAIPRGPVNTQTAQQPAALPESQPVTNQAPSGPVIIGSGAPKAPEAQAKQPATEAQGQQAASQSQPHTTAPQAATTETATSDGVSSAKTGPTPVPRTRPANAPKSTAVATTKPVAKEEPKKPAAKAQTGFLLPVQGRIVSEFGPKSGGLHNDGINIAAPRGTPILATAEGEIAYAGDGLPGFGNLILVRHDDGWTSAYAHADSMAVKRGDQVKRGDTIGAVGSTGTVTEPQLHFELRKHDRAVDPKPLLGP